jgi:glucan phosphoethanolaminetransferase (alkaline phosphatase superfamily)
MTDQSATPPASVSTPAPAEKLGGWLILLMAGLVLTLLNQLQGLPDTFQLFGTLSTANVDPILSNLVQLDLIVGIALYLIAPIVLLVLMAGRRRRFVRLFITWAIVSAVFTILDLMLGYALGHASLEAEGQSFFGFDMLRQLLGPAVALCIWTPYLLQSQRAKTTFVN